MPFGLLGLLFQILNVCCWNQLSHCPAQDLHFCRAATGVDSFCMALRYTACRLLNLQRNYYLAHDIFATCSDVGILRRKRYLHRSSRRSFTCSSSDVVFYPTFRCKPRKRWYNPVGVNYNNLSALTFKEHSSVLSESPHQLKSAFF